MSEPARHVDEPSQLGGEDRLDRAQRTLPRRRFFSDMPDKGLFALVAVSGFAGILMLKVRGVDADLVAGGAVILMLLYGFVAFQFRRVRLRPDRLGDNFYYLGFIYTLASLSAALLQLRGGGVLIEELVGSFGIALFTTIVGVAGRVLFVQMRGDIDEVEDEVRRDLLSASADLRAQLNTTLAGFETFHTGVQQAAKKAAEQSTTVVQDAISNISRVANAAAENIDQAFAREADKLYSFEQALVRIERGLNTTLAGFETFHTGMQQAAKKAAEQSSTMVQDAISNISRVANAAAENIDQAFGREADKLHSFEQALVRIEKGLKDLTTEMSDRVYDLSDNLERMVGQLAIAIELISRKKPKYLFWPFGRK